MAESIRAGWKTYIFVSSKMPRTSLVDLAAEASMANAVLILNGFEGRPGDMVGMQQFISEINNACCKSHKPAWAIHPKLVDRYHVVAAPSFVVGYGELGTPNNYSLVAGDMTLANALKYMVKESKLDAVRKQADKVYAEAFEGKYNSN